MAIGLDTEATPRVSQLAASIQRALRDVGAGWVEGEVQRRKTVGGHTYFTLADEDASIDCCVWRSRAARIKQWPADGQLVQVHFDKVDFYARRGSVSVHVDAIRLTGEGELLARKQATLDELTAEGLVARARRPLPAFPRRVGVIAARDSDAKVDVIKALSERWPSVHIVHRPAFVEGVRAVDSVIEALAHLQDIDAVDVIVVARGGGGVRDLVAFDDGRLCRAVFACAVPVVTSIGHTAQRPNCDFVAAASADVPARTAELVVPSIIDVAAELDRCQTELAAVHAVLQERRDMLQETWSRARPAQAVDRRSLELAARASGLALAASNFQTDRQSTLDDARLRLAQLPAQLPTPAALDAPAEQLRRKAAGFFEDRAEELGAALGGLATVHSRVPAPEDVQALADRLGPAAARARRRSDDYDRAFARLREQANRTLGRRLHELNKDVGQVADGMAVAARRGVAEAKRSLGHVVELIAAKDFRRSGWVLASDSAGHPVRSAQELQRGAELRVHFHDGVADAAVTHVHHEGEAS